MRDAAATISRVGGFNADAFRSALDASLSLLGADPLKRGESDDGDEYFLFPNLDVRVEADASWSTTLDSLRVPRRSDQKVTDWRREAPIRPVVFKDAGTLTEETVHLHLEQRIAQRLLARFRSQGFIYHDLSRACLAQAGDSIPRVVLLGRLSLYGGRAERLHEEVIPITARWVRPEMREGPLKPFARNAEGKTMGLLEESLQSQTPHQPSQAIRRQLLEAVPRDVEELLPYLQPRAAEHAAAAEAKLTGRGEREAQSLLETLERQRERVQQELAKGKERQSQITLGLEDPDTEEDERQFKADMEAWRARLAQFERDLRRRAGSCPRLLRGQGGAPRARGARLPLAGVELTMATVDPQAPRISSGSATSSPRALWSPPRLSSRAGVILAGDVEGQRRLARAR